ncbi:hypothetical protein [Halobacillus litoralis]|uniref:hypothetical protein n=1 Tax=Halobacillus litoralis TaxID=45668 RepID=UPI001CD3A736|nr:hypothetical protein [Halobacillus litoralis]MCA1021606.1 hypothetical protein [Halobacillus litoralis]
MTELYKKYLNGEVEICDMTKDEFNQFMIEHYQQYKSRNGEMTFGEFIKFCEEMGV